MGLNYQEDKIIYMSLAKSDKLDVFESLDGKSKSNMEDYIKHLRNTFGPTVAERRIQFTRLKQNEHEDEQQYFERVKEYYFTSRRVLSIHHPFLPKHWHRFIFPRSYC